MYFLQLLRYKKWLAVVVFLFFLLTIVANLIKTETTPFFVWGMYSSREPMVKNYDVLEVMVNGEALLDFTSGYTDANRYYLLSPLLYHIHTLQDTSEYRHEQYLKGKTGILYPLLKTLGQNSFREPMFAENFRQWYLRYAEQSLHRSIDSLQIYELTLAYDQMGHVTREKQTLITQWKKQ